VVWSWATHLAPGGSAALNKPRRPARGDTEFLVRRRLAIATCYYCRLQIAVTATAAAAARQAEAEAEAESFWGQNIRPGKRQGVGSGKCVMAPAPGKQSGRAITHWHAPSPPPPEMHPDKRAAARPKPPACAGPAAPPPPRPHVRAADLHTPNTAGAGYTHPPCSPRRFMPLMHHVPRCTSRRVKAQYMESCLPIRFHAQSLAQALQQPLAFEELEHVLFVSLLREFLWQKHPVRLRTRTKVRHAWTNKRSR
jgi:hypothetical protein